MVVYCVNDKGRQEIIGCALDIDNAKRVALEYASREGVFPYGPDESGESKVDIDNQSVQVHGWWTTFGMHSPRIWELMLVDTDSNDVFGSSVVICEFAVEEAN